MRIKLKQLMDDYEWRKKTKMTYSILSERTGIPVNTLKSIGSRRGYNASMEHLNLICATLHVTPGELLEVDVSLAEETRRANLRKQKGKKSISAASHSPRGRKR